jgi:hypothetical protein
MGDMKVNDIGTQQTAYTPRNPLQTCSENPEHQVGSSYP